MPKFVKRAVLLGIVLAVPHTAWGADSEFPVLNSIGRFLGVGYRRGGYQAAQDGRFDAVANRHPASNYRIGGLPHYSQPLYSPPPKATTLSSPVVAPNLAAPKSADNKATPQTPGAKPSAPEAIAPPKPTAPTKPAGPPPRWLEDYLQGEDAKDEVNEIPQPKNNAQPSGNLPESSPSDLLLEQPLGDAESDIEPGKEVDFSIFDAGYPINGRRARLQQSPVQVPAIPTVNRYRY